MEFGHLTFNSTSSNTGHLLMLGGSSSPIVRGTRTVLGFEEGASKRLPFFTTTEDLLEEEYYDEQLPEKKRRLTPEQVHLLERSFEAENKLEPEKKCELAKKLVLPPRQVAVWFQNRRARWKTKQLESDFDLLKSSYDALRSEHDSLLKDNDRLRSQLLALTEKLREKEMAESAGNLLGSDARATLLIKEKLSEAPPAPPQQRGEDRLSFGSRGSVVVDGDCSGDSYFLEGLMESGAGCCVGPVDCEVGSEEDGGSSNDDCSYLPADGMFEDNANGDNCWVWS